MTLKMSRGASVVATVCVAVMALNVLSVLVAGSTGQQGAIIASIVAAILIPLFWVGSARLIDVAARQMGAPSARARYLDLSGRLYPMLLLYAGLALIASLSHHFAPSADPIVGVIVPVLAFASIGWFVISTAVAARRVYQVEPLNAVALAFLPYGAVCTLLIVAVVGISVFAR